MANRAIVFIVALTCFVLASCAVPQIKPEEPTEAIVYSSAILAWASRSIGVGIDDGRIQRAEAIAYYNDMQEANNFLDLAFTAYYDGDVGGYEIKLAEANQLIGVIKRFLLERGAEWEIPK